MGIPSNGENTLSFMYIFDLSSIIGIELHFRCEIVIIVIDDRGRRHRAIKLEFQNIKIINTYMIFINQLR